MMKIVFKWGKWHDRFMYICFFIVIVIESGIFTACAIAWIYFLFRESDKWSTETTELLKIMVKRIKGE